MKEWRYQCVANEDRINTISAFRKINKQTREERDNKKKRERERCRDVFRKEHMKSMVAEKGRDILYITRKKHAKLSHV